jgi:hypothetical protein
MRGVRSSPGVTFGISDVTISGIGRGRLFPRATHSEAYLLAPRSHAQSSTRASKGEHGQVGREEVGGVLTYALFRVTDKDVLTRRGWNLGRAVALVLVAWLIRSS